MTHIRSFTLITQCTKCKLKYSNHCYITQSIRKFSKFSIKINTISSRFYTKQQEDGIPDWIPKFEDLTDEPQYLIDFDEKDEEISEQEIENNSIKDIVNINDININKNISTINLENKNALILDKFENNTIYPSISSYKFTSSLSDIPSDILTEISNKLPVTAEDAANWPIPPWHNKGFIEPQRSNNNDIIINNLTKYPEMFTNDLNLINLYKNQNNDISLSYEDKVTEANIKNEKLLRQKEINDLLKKRKEPVSIRKLSIIEDDLFRIKVYILMFIITSVIYLKYRIKPQLNNDYGYTSKKDVDRDKRLQKLPINWRKDGDIKHENDLAHLKTINDSLLFEIKPVETEQK